MLWREWLLVVYFIAIGPLTSYFLIRSLTKISYTKQFELTGTKIVDGKLVIYDSKKFTHIFVLLSIIGLPILVGIFLWVALTDSP